MMYCRNAFAVKALSSECTPPPRKIPGYAAGVRGKVADIPVPADTGTDTEAGYRSAKGNQNGL